MFSKNGGRKNWTYPDPRTKDPKERRWQRFFEILPGFLTWTTLLGMFFFSFFLPIWVALFIILYDIYWLHRTVYIATYSILAYKKMKRWNKVDWLYRIQNVGRGDKLRQEIKKELADLKIELGEHFFKRSKRKEIKRNIQEREEFLKRLRIDYRNRKKFLNWKSVYHVIMLPTVGESARIVEPAVKSIEESIYPNDKIIILLALEERENQESRDRKVKILKDKFGNKFFDFIVTVHKVKAGEMKCKASNTTYAAKKLKKYLERKNIPLENVVLSNFDCDTQVHPQFLAALTYEYIVSPNRLQQAYQPLPMYHNNLWDTIAPVRIIVTGSSFWHMVESMRPEHMVTFSSHSEPFKTIVDVDYWPVNVISEDSVIYWKAYDYFSGNYRVRPIYLPVSLDAVLSSSYMKTIANQYRQKRRWAYGIENLAMLARAFKNNKKIPFLKKIKYLWTMLEGHHSWATSPFILALLGWLPLIFGGDAFNESVLAHNLPYITRFLMTLALVGLVISMFLSFLIMPARPKKYSRKKYLAMFFQWVIAPFIAPILGASPAVDAQTRLMFGKYFGSFWVTPKETKDE
ncbi:MAG: glycosyltransferase family 2 protein [Candidatus Moranbacteria bacterium]|nr:glycosyltransferase family 2 protein [Candidatus Moranbacteria bacterium]